MRDAQSNLFRYPWSLSLSLLILVYPLFLSAPRPPSSLSFSFNFANSIYFFLLQAFYPSPPFLLSPSRFSLSFLFCSFFFQQLPPLLLSAFCFSPPLFPSFSLCFSPSLSSPLSLLSLSFSGSLHLDLLLFFSSTLGSLLLLYPSVRPFYIFQPPSLPLFSFEPVNMNNMFLHCTFFFLNTMLLICSPSLCFCIAAPLHHCMTISFRPYCNAGLCNLSLSLDRRAQGTNVGLCLTA